VAEGRWQSGRQTKRLDPLFRARWVVCGQKRSGSFGGCRDLRTGKNYRRREAAFLFGPRQKDRDLTIQRGDAKFSRGGLKRLRNNLGPPEVHGAKHLKGTPSALFRGELRIRLGKIPLKRGRFSIQNFGRGAKTIFAANHARKNMAKR